MKDISGECAWVPAGLTISDAVLASMFVMSLPDGIAVRYTEYQGGDPAVRTWMRRWFEDRLEKYRREKPDELAEPTGVISLSVQRIDPGEFSLLSAIVASKPAVPDHWPEVAYSELLATAIAFLS
jgi:hypothetical protein